MENDVAVLILAAGYSLRMGAFKPLLPFGKRTVAAYAVDNARRAGLKKIIVVTGFRSAELEGHLADTGATLIHNPSFSKGMFSSLKTGMRRLPPGTKGFFMLPVDTPLIRPATFQILLRAFEATDGKGVFVPRFGGRRGHPPLLGESAYEAVMAWEGAEGLRGFLASPAANCVEIEVPDRHMLSDMDVPETYEQLRRALLDYDIPTREECLTLLKSELDSKALFRHCLAVSHLALLIGRHIQSAGWSIHLRLIEASGLLHDIARSQRHHAECGAALLRRFGFGRVADVVAMHMDLPSLLENTFTEAEAVFLADKHLLGGTPLSLEERFAQKLAAFRGDSPACSALRRRLNQARRVREKFERMSDVKMPLLLEEFKRRHPLEF